MRRYMATMTDLLPDDLAKALTQTPELRQAYLVGGCVRDWLSGRPCKDFDVEVYGVGYDQLVDLLSRWGKTDLADIPGIAAWRQAYRAFGIKRTSYRSSVERLVGGRCTTAPQDQERQRQDQESVPHPGPDPDGHLFRATVPCAPQPMTATRTPTPPPRAYRRRAPRSFGARGSGTPPPPCP